MLVCAGVLDIMLLGRMIWGPTGLVEYQSLKAQYQGLQDKIAQLDETNRSLSRDIRLLQTDQQYVEKIIRQRLHYLRGNEVVYLFAGSDKHEAGEDAGKN